MIEIAEELVETMHGGQELVAVALVVLAKLTGGIALRLQNRCHRHIGLLPALWRSGNANLGHAGAQRIVATDECCTARGAALLSVVVGEGNAFLGDTVDIRCLVAHQTTVVVADVGGADVVTPDHKDVRLLVLGSRLSRP